MSACIICSSHRNNAPSSRPAPTTRVCTKCQQEKPIEDFPLKNAVSGKRQAVCKECTAKRTNEWYYRNRAHHISNVTHHKQNHIDDAREYITDYLSWHPCIDCGENDPDVLDFDHRYNKDFSISHALTRGYSVTRIAAEISKCDVRCANCHRIKTASERGWYKGLIK